MTSPIPAPIQSVLELFATSLADVRFADVDAEVLARVAGDVEEAAGILEAAQAALDAAREGLQEKQDALLQQAQRALAYARVYAETDESLSARLEAITLPRAPRRSRAEDALVLSADAQPAPRPRGRPRKASVVESTLTAPILAEMMSPAE